MKTLYYKIPRTYKEFSKIYNSYPKRFTKGGTWLPHTFYKNAKSDYKNNAYLIFSYKNGEYIIEGYCQYSEIYESNVIIKELPKISEKYSKKLLILDIERLN